MHMKLLLSAGLAALALNLAAAPADAAPLGGIAAVAQETGRSGAVEKATWYGDYGYRPHYHYRVYKPYRFYNFGYRYNFGYHYYNRPFYGRFHGDFGPYSRYGYHRYW